MTWERDRARHRWRCAHVAFVVSDDVLDQNALEIGHGTVLRGADDDSQQAITVHHRRRLHWFAPSFGEASAGPAPQLPSVGTADRESLGDLGEAVAESLPQHEDRALGRRQPLNQEPDGVPEPGVATQPRPRRRKPEPNGPAAGTRGGRSAEATR